MLGDTKYDGESLDFWLGRCGLSENGDEYVPGDERYEWLQRERRGAYLKRISLTEREKEILRNPELLPGMGTREFRNLLSKLELSLMASEMSRITRLSRSMSDARGSFLAELDIVCLKVLAEEPGRHEIEYRIVPDSGLSVVIRKRLFVDGLPSYLWLSAFHPEANPNFHTMRAVSGLRKYGRDDLIPAVLKANREKIIAENRVIVKKFGLPERCVENGGWPLPFTGLVNGIPYGRWKLLNDPEYRPTKTHLVYWIRYFEKNGDTETAEEIRDRFDFMLNPRRPKEFITEKQYRDAEENIRRILSLEYSRLIISEYESSLKDGKEQEDDVCAG